MAFYKTPAVADLLGVSYYRLIGLLRSRRLTPPQKDSSGDYVWTDEDIARARQALESGRRYENDLSAPTTLHLRAQEPIDSEATQAGRDEA